MTLQASGAIALSDVSVEKGAAATAPNSDLNWVKTNSPDAATALGSLYSRQYYQKNNTTTYTYNCNCSTNCSACTTYNCRGVCGKNVCTVCQQDTYYTATNCSNCNCASDCNNCDATPKLQAVCNCAAANCNYGSVCIANCIYQCNCNCK